MNKVYNIPVEATLDVLGGKWKPVIVCHLSHGTLRTNELRKKIPAVTQKMLTQQLRELEADQIISRKVYDVIPPKVEYSLTEHGKTLNHLITCMSEWELTAIKQKEAMGETVTLLHNGINIE